MKKILSIFLILALIITYSTISFAQGGTPPDIPSGGQQGAPGGTPPDGNPGQGGGTSTPEYSGATSIAEDTAETEKEYSSKNGSENALLVSGGTSTITNAKITKSGDSDGDNSDFYGTNAAVLAYNGAVLNINGGTITTNGSHANGVFAYKAGVINISDATINTSSNNSGAIMVTGGGTLNANNVKAETQGNSSAPIRSDRGGGNLIVAGGSYTSNGSGSPAIYSTANITVNDATLTSTKSEGAVVEGANSITLNNTKLIDTNTNLHGNSETYKNIFLYQSMSGDADQGTASFKATDSEIITNKGDTIFVTNTTANINLTNNKITNNDIEGAFLRIQAGKWGKSGENGGNVVLNTQNQAIEGDIYVDNISILEMSLTEKSNYVGTINANNTAKKLAITLDTTSTLTLTGDSYVTELSNAVSDNSNINLNGHTLYVNGEAITSTNYKGQNYDDENENTTTLDDMIDKKGNTTKALIATVVTVGVLIAIVAIVSRIKKKE